VEVLEECECSVAGEEIHQVSGDGGHSVKDTSAWWRMPVMHLVSTPDPNLGSAPLREVTASVQGTPKFPAQYWRCVFSPPLLRLAC
jgi:hypothetical protein